MSVQTSTRFFMTFSLSKICAFRFPARSGLRAPWRFWGSGQGLRKRSFLRSFLVPFLGGSFFGPGGVPGGPFLGWILGPFGRPLRGGDFFEFSTFSSNIPSKMSGREPFGGPPGEGILIILRGLPGGSPGSSRDPPGGPDLRVLFEGLFSIFWPGPPGPKRRRVAFFDPPP